jgi:hypothetical protein
MPDLIAPTLKQLRAEYYRSFAAMLGLDELTDELRDVAFAAFEALIAQFEAERESFKSFGLDLPSWGPK